MAAMMQALLPYLGTTFFIICQFEMMEDIANAFDFRRCLQRNF